MKQTITRFLLLGVILLSALTTSAYDAEIDGIYYFLNYDGTATVTSGHNRYVGDIVIPATVTEFGLTFSVTSIGKEAFLFDDLTSIVIPNSVTSIGEDAFRGCSDLSSVTLPNSVTDFGWGVFRECNSLPVIDGCRYAGTYLIEVLDKNVTDVIIMNGTKYIGEAAFQSCSSLTSITIPNSVTFIGKSAFNYCTSLTSISLPNSVTRIGSYAFHHCSKLTSINIPSSVTCIEDHTFDDCIYEA